MKLVNLADANGNSDQIVVLGDEDEMTLLADKGLPGPPLTGRAPFRRCPLPLEPYQPARRTESRQA